MYYLLNTFDVANVAWWLRFETIYTYFSNLVRLLLLLTYVYNFNTNLTLFYPCTLSRVEVTCAQKQFLFHAFICFFLFFKVAFSILLFIVISYLKFLFHVLFCLLFYVSIGLSLVNSTDEQTREQGTLLTSRLEMKELYWRVNSRPKNLTNERMREKNSNY